MRVKLIEPVEYDVFIRLMAKSYLVLTDSGGIQEEAPTLGIPVIVLRDETERPEAVQAGAVRLAGTEAEKIINETKRLLCDHDAYTAMAVTNRLYGDGHAAQRIAAVLRKVALERGKAKSSSSVLALGANKLAVALAN